MNNKTTTRHCGLYHMQQALYRIPFCLYWQESYAPPSEHNFALNPLVMSRPSYWGKSLTYKSTPAWHLIDIVLADLPKQEPIAALAMERSYPFYQSLLALDM